MNWKEISEKYPKAWAGLCNWIADTRCRNAFGEYRLSLSGSYTCLNYNGKFTYDDKNGWTEFNPRDLYDYFDGLGIYGRVDIAEFNDDSRPVDWCYTVDEPTGSDYQKDGFDTRTAAESALFTRMFELRESQLTEATK